MCWSLDFSEEYIIIKNALEFDTIITVSVMMKTSFSVVRRMTL